MPGFDFGTWDRWTQPEFLRLVKRGTHTNAEDNTAAPDSDSLWAEFDALDGAFV